jgi:beta-lactam-binding protein with PASTA domain
MKSGLAARTCLFLLLIGGGAAAQRPPPAQPTALALQERPLRPGVELLQPGRFSTVPSLIGHRQEELARILETVHLRPGRVEFASSDRPEGLVFDQTPRAGAAVRWGTAVDVVVSRGEDKVIVPGVVGRPFETARQMLARAGLVVGEVFETPAENPPRTVVDQKPGPRAVVPRGSPVDLAIAAAPIARVPVPNLIGRGEDECRRSLRESGLRAGTREERHDESAAGTVVEQKPGANALVPPGTPVDFVVSAGPIVRTVPSPLPTPTPSPTPTPEAAFRPTRGPPPSPAPTATPMEKPPYDPRWPVGLAVVALAVIAYWFLRLPRPDGDGNRKNLLEGIEIRPRRDEGRQRPSREPEPQSRITLVVRRDDGTQRLRNV